MRGVWFIGTRNEEQGKVDGSYKAHTERVLSLGPENQQFTAGFNNVVVSRVVSLAMAPDTMETLLDATFTRIYGFDAPSKLGSLCGFGSLPLYEIGI